MFTGLFTILGTADLPGLLAFYRDGLDGTETYRFPAEGPPGFVSLDVAGAHLGIAATSGGAPDPERLALWVYADDCDTAVDRLVGAGATVVTPPTDMPWGERVAALADPDGNRLNVAHELKTSGAEPT